MRPPPRFRTGGFTLVELLIVMVVLGIAAVTIASLSANLFRGQTESRALAVGTPLMQECAELLLAKGRADFTDAALASSTAATTACSTISLGAYAAPTVTISAGNSATSGLAACPFASGSDCKRVSVSQDGLAPLVFMLVKR